MGAARGVRKDAGIRVTGWRYPQEAIVCTVEHELPHAFIAHEHFLPAGPFAILPLRGTRRTPVAVRPSFGLNAPNSRAPWSTLMTARFLTELARRFGDFMGEIEVVGPSFCHPLGLQFAETAVAERLVLVGDADHGMHPIAGQGLNMGYRDVGRVDRCD